MTSIEAEEQEVEATREKPVEWRSKEPIIRRHFGEGLYRYRLKLKSKIPNTLYKERNFNIGVTLVDHYGKTVMNCK